MTIAAVPARYWYPQARVVLQVIFDGYGDSVRDSPITVIPVLPKSATVHINSYKQADSFQIVLEVGDFPVDPRLIRAGAAEVFIFQTASNTDRRRVLGRRSPLVSADPGGVRQRSALDTVALELGIDASRDSFTLGNKPRIVGTFDDADIELSESGKFVTIKGQDYTAYLAATPFPPLPNGVARRIPIGKRIDLIFEDLLEEADPDGQLSVDVRGLDRESLPVVGPENRSQRRGITVENGTSYWDVMYKLALRVGLICYVDGLDVVLSRPKTITDKDSPTIKRMAWGKNLEHLTMRRHIGREQAPTVVVRSYDPRVGTITAEYPSGQIDRSGIFVTKNGRNPVFKRRVKERTTTSKTGKVKTTVRERDEYQIFTVHGISDPAILQRIAENRYHLLGKSERSVIMRTRDLNDLNQADLLSVSAGDAFTIDWDEFNIEMLENPSLSTAAKVKHMVDRGFNVSVANEIARRYQLLRSLDRPLRFKEGTIEYDNEDGISIECELQDFMVMDGIRADSGAERTPTLVGRRSLLKRDGSQIGWSAKYAAAQQKRFDKNQ